MIDFRELQLSDKNWIDEHLREADFQGCEYSFTSNYIWRNIYNIQVAEVEGFYVARTGSNGKYSYSIPAGKGDMEKVIAIMMEDAKERDYPFVLRGITENQINMLEGWFPGVFQFELNRDESDYVYTVEKLSKLAGKKLHGKRNHIRRFMDSPDWEYYDVTSENVHECIEMNKKWREQYVTEDDTGLIEESYAVNEILQHFTELNIKGGILKKEGQVVAYTIGEPLNHNTYVIHIEKAFYDVQGAYPMINQQFVLHNCQDYEYVNREEDTGDEGLRKAKLSYYPDILLDKYIATYRQEDSNDN